MTGRNLWGLVGLCWLGLGVQSAAAGLILVGHLGGVSASQEIEQLEELDWKTGVVDLALESSVFGPISLGIGGEALFDTDELDLTDKTAGFAYAKVRVPVPLSPYAGVGAEVRRASSYDAFGTIGDKDWHVGRLWMAGLGFKLSRISLDLEFRYSRLELDDNVHKLYSVRPGVSLWF